MSTEFANQADELANRPPATELPPLLLQQAEAVDWAPPPWPTGGQRNAPLGSE